MNGDPKESPGPANPPDHQPAQAGQAGQPHPAGPAVGGQGAAAPPGGEGGRPAGGEPGGRPDLLGELRGEIRATNAAQGGIQANLATEREARNAVGAGNDVLGGFVGGNFNNFAPRVTNNFFSESEVGVRLRRLSLADLAATEAFVPQPGFDALEAVARRTHLLVVRGRAGCGRTAAGLKVLVTRTTGAVHELAPDTDLRRFLAQEPAKDAGYILSNLTQAQADELGSFDLLGLADRLEQRRAYLVVTAAPEVRMPGVRRMGLAAELTGPAHRAEVLARHLAFWLAGLAAYANGAWDRRDRPAGQQDTEAGFEQWALDERASAARRAARLLATDSVRAVVDARLSADVPMETVAFLAQVLAEAAEDGEEDPAAAAQASLAKLDDDDFEHWFAGLTSQTNPINPDDQNDPTLLTLAIALAVLQGEPYETVTTAADALRRCFVDPGDGRPAAVLSASTTSPAILLTDRDTELTRLRATLATTSVETRHGAAAPASVARYVDESYPRRALLRVWRYHQAQPRILAWLRYLGGHPIETVRVRAAVAAGALAAVAFDVVRAEVLMPWALSDASRERDAAAIALHDPAADSRLADAVDRLVKSWLSDGNPRLQATAVRAYGASLGEHDPAEALRQLDALAETDKLGVLNAICHSVCELLLTAGSPETEARVLEQLIRWTSGPRSELGRARARTGWSAFLIAAADLVSQLPSPSRGEVTWPALLRIATVDQRRRAEIAYLWESALNAELWEAAHDVLTIWAIMLDDLPRGQEAFAQLVVDQAQSARTLTIIRRAAISWQKADPDPPAPRTAETVLAHIAARSR
ncbi:hypothetical protein [Pseudofrankia saprophytica]|uniref:hypothetical protein n=1 Tax=Pseudofrankia saprophytica TaxID=298655 RepID=UPI000234C2C6|nr:hypothetical protein [Pseudofrankia saprophytica]